MRPISSLSLATLGVVYGDIGTNPLCVRQASPGCPDPVLKLMSRRVVADLLGVGYRYFD